MQQTKSDSLRNLFDKTECVVLPRPGRQATSDSDFEGSTDKLNGAFVYYLAEFVPFVARGDRDKCPTLKVDPLGHLLTVDDFIDQVKVRFQFFIFI